MRRKAQFLSVVILVILVLAVTGCSTASTQSTVPVAGISSPQADSIMTIGQETQIAFNAADIKGIAQVELSIDGQPVLVETVDPPVNSYSASHRWLIDEVGSHVIEFRAFNVDQEPSEIAQIFVTVTGTAEQIEPTSTVVENPFTPTPTIAVVNTSTASPQFSPTPTETAVPTDNPALVTALVGLNIRLGPSTAYTVLGRLPQGESALITGRDEFANWWQIEYSSARGDKGWVSAGAEFSRAENSEAVPSVAAPPPNATPAPTQPPPTPTSAALKPTIFSFTADRYAVAPGENVTLSWDLANAGAAFLRFEGVEEGIVSPGSKTVSITKDTTYILVARNEAGDTVAELTIKLNSDTTVTPVPILRDGKIRIANGQSVDFDQGIVQSEVTAEMDFLWDGQQQRFFPQSGASGALLSRDFSSITWDDCRTATYGEPIDGVDGSTQVTGCYLTNEGRFGKFLVSEWDIAANLTVEWLTWR